MLPSDDVGGEGGMSQEAAVDFERWSPTPLRSENEEMSSDLCPFPLLETLSLVNNLVGNRMSKFLLNWVMYSYYGLLLH